VWRLEPGLTQKSKIIVGYSQYRNAVASGRTSFAQKRVVS
jgi:hypothetical protein